MSEPGRAARGSPDRFAARGRSTGEALANVLGEVTAGAKTPAVSAIDRRRVARWLEAHGFVARTGATSHINYVKGGIVITLQGHGPTELSKKHVGMILRQLERAGYARAEVRRQWQAG
jgi:predicted RNA binding protein YcfA (HicA-like mRNA interferase family)